MALHAGHAVRFGIRIAERPDEKYKSVRNPDRSRRGKSAGRINKLTANTAEFDEGALRDRSVIRAKS